MEHKKIFYLMVVIQIVFLLGMIGMKQATVVYGERVLLKPVPVDPTDPFRGDYVTIGYEISTFKLASEQQKDFLSGQKVFVGLKEADGVSKIREVSKKSLDSPYIKGVVDRIDYKTVYTLKEKKSAKEYTYEVISYEPEISRDLTMYPDLKNEFTAGEEIEFTSSEENGFVYFVTSCEAGCPSEKNSFDNTNYQKGTITKVDKFTEMIIAYPINAYFVPKKEGWRKELREFDKLLVEVALWRGDAVVTNILYNGQPIEFSDNWKNANGQVQY